MMHCTEMSDRRLVRFDGKLDQGGKCTNCSQYMVVPVPAREPEVAEDTIDLEENGIAEWVARCSVLAAGVEGNFELLTGHLVLVVERIVGLEACHSATVVEEADAAIE